MRPSFDGRIRALREGRHGTAGAFGVFYRTAGLIEPEGEIEAVASVGRHVGRNYLLANLTYVQHSERNERDAEVALAAWALGSMLFLGLDGRPLSIRPGVERRHAGDPHEAVEGRFGPLITALLGPIALSLQGAGSTYRLQGATSYGAFARLELGTTF